MLKLVARTGAPVDVSKTLADVISAVDGIQHLSKGRRCDLKTAVRTVARIMDRPPSGIGADLSMIREALETAMPAQHGLTEKRWSSIRSDFMGALRLTGIAEPLATSKAVLSEPWRAFLEGVVIRDYQTGMSRFARFCSLNGVEPEQVNDHVLQAFATALTTATLVTKPGHILRKTARCWNATRGIGAAAIGKALTVQSNRPPLKRVPLSAMPESFCDDLEAWLKDLEASDPFATNARNKPLRPVTISGYRDRVISAVAAAVCGGISIESITSLKRLVQPDVFKTILSHRHRMTEGKPGPQTQGIATILMILAKTWCEAPPEQIEELKKLRAKLPALKQGMVEKNRNFLNAFEDPRLQARFMAIPDLLWREATSSKTRPGRSLVAAQLSLLFGIVTVVPLRLKNLAALSFTDNLSWPRGPKGPALLFVPGADMKNAEDYTAELPATLAQRLLIYRTRIAPEVLGHMPDHLFVTQDGKCKVMATIAVEFKAIAKRELGILMTPHQTRHLAAKLLLDAYPAAYPLVQQLLGHSSLATTIKSYAGVNTRRASRTYAELLDTMKSSPIASATGRKRSRTLTEKGSAKCQTLISKAKSNNASDKVRGKPKPETSEEE